MLQFIINNADVIFGVVGAVATAGGVIAGLFTKTSKAKKCLLAIGEISNHLPSFIKTAEKLGGTGEEKKAYVMEQVVLWLKAQHVTPTQAQLDSISTQIDEDIKLTKTLHTDTVKPVVVREVNRSVVNQ